MTTSKHNIGSTCVCPTRLHWSHTKVYKRKRSLSMKYTGQDEGGGTELKFRHQSGMVAHTCDLSTWERQAEEKSQPDCTIWDPVSKEEEDKKWKTQISTQHYHVTRLDWVTTSSSLTSKWNAAAQTQPRTNQKALVPQSESNLYKWKGQWHLSQRAKWLQCS